jgi:cell division protein FtsQ
LKAIYIQRPKYLTLFIGELVNKMVYVDMRYPNGYAVRWRENEKIEW